MNRTPHYKLQFYQRGDMYKASEDLQRMTTIDNQLLGLSEITKDGALFGWNIYRSKDTDVSAGNLDISVSIGSGFISNLYQSSLGIKNGTVIDNSNNFIYIQTTAFNKSGGFPLEIQGPFSSPPADAIFTDITPPQPPTNFNAQSVSFDIINLTWDANTEIDISSYTIERSTSSTFSTSVVMDKIKINGTSSNPYQDTELVGSTNYYYRIKAIDTSGNQSSWSMLQLNYVTTLPDTRVSSEIFGLVATGGDCEISIAFFQSSTDNFQSYRISLDLLNPDGSVDVPSVYTTEGTSLSYQITGLVNNKKYIVSVKTRALSDDGVTPPGNLSTGVKTEASTSKTSAPFNVLNPSTTPKSGSILFNWTASQSPSSSTTLPVSGYKVKYLIIPIIENKEAYPIDVGLVNSFTVYGYNEILDFGFGPDEKFKERKTYIFKICTEDGFGNRSSGAYVTGSILTTTTPNKPRAFFAESGDKQATLHWNHSSSEGVTGYGISYKQCSGFCPEILIPYTDSFILTGLINDVSATVRIRAINDANLFSDYVSTASTPVEDTTPPPIPLHVRLSSSDNQIEVTWEKINSPDITLYKIKKSLVNAPSNFSINMNPVVVEEYIIDVGVTSSFIDIGVPKPLENGKQYGYSVVAIRTNASGRQIEGEFSSVYYVMPNEGLNTGADKLLPPTDVFAAFDSISNSINISWNFLFHDMVYNVTTGKWEYPIGNGPTAFNVYRSENSLVNFEIIATIDAGLRQYEDYNLINGKRYYYLVAAIRDNIVLIIDTGNIQPAHSVFIGNVKALSGNIVEIDNDKRIISKLESSINEESKQKIIEHKHSVAPINFATVIAQSSITMIEANTFRSQCFSGANFACSSTLNPDCAKLYINAVIESQENTYTTVVNSMQSSEGIPISGSSTIYEKNANYVNYDKNTVYFIDPRLVVWNPPYVGDYQILINDSKPSIPFSIDHDINAIIFQSPLQDTDVVTLDGQGLSFYIPSKIDRDYFGYDIYLNEEIKQDVQVSEINQTINFLIPLDMSTSPSVTVRLDPVVPNFSGLAGPKQINLSPNIVLNDFIAQGLYVYKSISGNFLDTNEVFVLVNGERTSFDHYVDFKTKSIVFSSPLSLNSNVSLEIMNVEETQKELSETKILGVDGSQIRNGTFLYPQLQSISHDGRIMEIAHPLFYKLSSSDNYVYSSGDSVGNGTTAYDFHVFNDGNFILGTSNGILRTFLVPGFLISSTDDLVLNSSLPIGSGVEFSKDTIIEASLLASKNSGRLYGELTLSVLTLSNVYENITIKNPSICILDNGSVFISGGVYSEACYIYNPSNQVATEIQPMSTKRAYHTCIKIQDGRVLICGGIKEEPSLCTCLTTNEFDNLDKSDGIIGSWFLKSAEMYDVSIGEWTQLPSMNNKRINHASVVINQNDSNSPILVTGGKWSHRLSAINFLSLDREDCENILYCDPDDSDVKIDQYISESELFNPISLTWSTVKPMIFPGETCEAKSDGEKVVITTSKSRQVYSYSTDSWETSDGKCDESTVGIVNENVDSPVKKFLRDNNGRLLAVTKKNIYFSKDNGRSWISMNGLSAIGTVHSICQSHNNTLYAATDLGVYEIENNLGVTWAQGGLIGSSTTETFDVISIDEKILAGTEIGIFSTIDNGRNWVEEKSIPNVVSIEHVGSGLVYALSDKDIYKSESYGNYGTWSKVGTYEFIDLNSKIVSRMPFELFISSDNGLYKSTDGYSFSLIELDRNKDQSKNNVHSIRMIGSDLYVSYDNEIVIIDPSNKTYLLSSFIGNVPTVKVNNDEVRTGFQYDVKNKQIIFNTKRFSDDVVEISSNYSLYQLDGGWYPQNPNPSLQVYVNKIEIPNSEFVYDSRLGKFSFNNQLEKHDIVSVSISGTTIKNGGMYFHSELEDKLEREKGLPLSMGRDFAGNILQIGISIEHNFLERGEERNQYYCLQNSLVDRSFTSFLPNSDFAIMGRKDYDKFNSTIDYKIESSQMYFGNSALVPLCSILYLSTEYWIGTDSGIFVLDPYSLFSLSYTIEIESNENSIRDMYYFSENVIAATKYGIYKLFKENGNIKYEKNDMIGLPDQIYTIISLNNYLIAGTNDGMYYSTSLDVPSYGMWYRSSHIPNSGQPIELVLDGKADCSIVSNGTAYSFIGTDLFLSNDGKLWKKVFSFPTTDDPNEKIRVSKMALFGGKLYAATNKGVYDDDGSVRSDQVSFNLNYINGEENSIIDINYITSDKNVLYAAANVNSLFKLNNQKWTKEIIPEAKSIHLVDIVSEKAIVVENNVIYME